MWERMESPRMKLNKIVESTSPIPIRNLLTQQRGNFSFLVSMRLGGGKEREGRFSTRTFINDRSYKRYNEETNLQTCILEQCMKLLISASASSLTLQ